MILQNLEGDGRAFLGAGCTLIERTLALALKRLMPADQW